MILIVSKDVDFSAVVAELVERELKYPCQWVKTREEAGTVSGKIDAVIASEPGKFKAPTLVVKNPPVKMRQLLADICAALQAPGDSDAVAIGDYAFSLRQKQLSHVVSGKSVSLTDKEAQLVKILAVAGKAGVGKEVLLKDVWGIDQVMDTHTLETHIYRLRAKLREVGDGLSIAVTGNGYRLE